jgi:hypothetical protein
MDTSLTDGVAVEAVRQPGERRRVGRERIDPVLARPRNALLGRRSCGPPRVDYLAHWIRYHELKFCPNANGKAYGCAGDAPRLE